MLCFQLLICIFKKLWRELSGLQCLYSLSCLLHLVTLSLLFIQVCECLGNMLLYRRGSALRETLTTSDDLAMGNMSSRSGNDLRAYWGSSDQICINQFHFAMYEIKQSNRSLFLLRRLSCDADALSVMEYILCAPESPTTIRPLSHKRSAVLSL